ncbi:MAG TPA: hypothetical protein PLH07_00320 [Sulfurovum sp.]|jgi:hypothetical protein|nr:MAG: hypothetical protein B7Y63_04685 [Sulfurovum sp. 35-42-20]OYZ26631.1 MAG: hypothetical protein B7Y23_01200 [Sulfurovum sp. 16-42-52]OYZ47988.1 MAG: hypothetical protein B7Y13_08945 [Sulfurovum sp. 24-42-9]OZA47086.1 MAG: hypothetical protein B7X80_00315 [Sulfurovum sp. 17-42-90]OZA59497.1 MAG: hypothetical protein B7X69_07740 [Sulfurovum sp. 39-42-12]HQR73944.1 hypothetical protein [Sulfurovum sp.]
MVKYIVMIALSVSGLYCQDAYERHCVECHQELPTSLQEMFKRYLLVYSGEQNVKAGLKHYLKHPLKEISVMDDLFLENYGVKEKTTLSDSDIDEALDSYWNKFKVFNKLK